MSGAESIGPSRSVESPAADTQNGGGSFAECCRDPGAPPPVAFPATPTRGATLSSGTRAGSRSTMAFVPSGPGGGRGSWRTTWCAGASSSVALRAVAGIEMPVIGSRGRYASVGMGSGRTSTTATCCQTSSPHNNVRYWGPSTSVFRADPLRWSGTPSGGRFRARGHPNPFAVGHAHIRH